MTYTVRVKLKGRIKVKKHLRLPVVADIDADEVTIINNSSTVLAVIPAPGTYMVTTFTGIRDRVISGNDTTIIDNIIPEP
jgi:hypothetical protein